MITSLQLHSEIMENNATMLQIFTKKEQKQPLVTTTGTTHCKHFCVLYPLTLNHHHRHLHTHLLIYTGKSVMIVINVRMCVRMFTRFEEKEISN